MKARRVMLISSFFCRGPIENDDKNELEIIHFLKAKEAIIEKLILHELNIHKALKIQFIVFASYLKTNNIDEVEIKQFNFQAKFQEYIQTTVFTDIFHQSVKNISSKSQEFLTNGSGFLLYSLDYIVLSINKWRQIRAKGKLKIPPNIAKKSCN